MSIPKNTPNSILEFLLENFDLLRNRIYEALKNKIIQLFPYYSIGYPLQSSDQPVTTFDLKQNTQIPDEFMNLLYL